MAVPTQDTCLAFLWVGRGKAVVVAWMWTLQEHTPGVWVHLLPRRERCSQKSQLDEDHYKQMQWSKKKKKWALLTIPCNIIWIPLKIDSVHTRHYSPRTLLEQCQGGMSLANVSSQTGRRDDEIPGQVTGFWDFVWYTKGAGRSPSGEYWFWEKPSICCRNDDFPWGITTTTGHCHSLRSRRQPSYSFCLWNCYRIAKKKQKTTTPKPTPLCLRKHGW